MLLLIISSSLIFFGVVLGALIAAGLTAFGFYVAAREYQKGRSENVVLVFITMIVGYIILICFLASLG